jgi:murein DD-endopeptidase MepM/ murein hydrolase activator NlpD
MFNHQFSILKVNFMSSRYLILSMFSLLTFTCFSQNFRTLDEVEHSTTKPCISDMEYDSINQEINRNLVHLGLSSIIYGTQPTIALEWPLKPSKQLNDCGYYYVAAYVDLNPSSGIVEDWNCGTRTYDGHRGIDIVSWPFIWDKMDNNLVEVIAAAAGKIVAKVDGNPDRICNGVGGGSTSNNYITVLHSDGSQALYVHLKSGSMTSKIVGDTVAVGEFLGIPGSAGQSTGQHLHFEIRSLGTFASYIDPNFGTCNTGIDASWWANQKPITEPEIIKLSTHSNWPYFGVCPNTHDTTYYADSFIVKTGAQGIFEVFTKHVNADDVWNFKILNPDQSVFDAWNYASFSSRLTSNLGWNKTMPTTPGKYTFEATFKGNTCIKTFWMKSAVSIDDVNPLAFFKISPNPTNGKVKFEFDQNTSSELEIQFYNPLGQLIHTVVLHEKTETLDLLLPKGFYFYKVSSKSNKQTMNGKLIVE